MDMREDYFVSEPGSSFDAGREGYHMVGIDQELHASLPYYAICR